MRRRICHCATASIYTKQKIILNGHACENLRKRTYGFTCLRRNPLFSSCSSPTNDELDHTAPEEEINAIGANRANEFVEVSRGIMV